METHSVDSILIQMASDISGVPAEEITMLSTWEELGMDSLELIELLSEVAGKWQPIPKNRIMAIDTLADLKQELEKVAANLPN